MRSTHTVTVKGIQITIWLDIDGQKLAERLGKKAGSNCNGKSTLAFGLVKASMSGHDLQRITASSSLR